MSSQPNPIFTAAPYHILSYGTLLGTQFFHSFINGTTMFRVLERPAFSTAQQALFPIYFGLQTALPAVLAITYPSSKNPFGPAGSFSGVLDSSNRWGVLLPLATMFLGGLANMAWIGPATTKTMKQRHAQEKKDGKKSYDPKPHSQEMLALNKKFGKLHGISSLVNLVSFIATVAYGFTLAGRIA